MNLLNRTVLITGANRGIGLAVVNELLKRGVRKIYAAARKPESLPNFADDRVVPLQLDITDPAQVRSAAIIASDTDLLINNAGVALWVRAFSTPVERSPIAHALGELAKRLEVRSRQHPKAKTMPVEQERRNPRMRRIAGRCRPLHPVRRR